MAKKKLAIVLFNLGGPDGPNSVQPFLRNLFADPAIIGAPTAIRLVLAELISRLRTKSAQANYAKMGGGSPLVPETQKQATALLEALAKSDLAAEFDFSCHIAMRYYHPYTQEAAEEVAALAPDYVILLPLYPQFSTTTTGSSFKAWDKAFEMAQKRLGIAPVQRRICCYRTHEDFIASHVALINQSWADNGSPENALIIFSAHGLPKKVIEGGDPYQAQIEETVAAITPFLPKALTPTIAYQSRVGPLEWIGPSTDKVIEEAAKAGWGMFIVPIAFISEHIETLVELDEEYGHLAKEHGAAFYHRVPALGVEPSFIKALAGLVGQAVGSPEPCFSGSNKKCAIEKEACSACPLKLAAA